MYREHKELTVPEVQHPCLPQWRQRIDEAEKRGAFTQADVRKARNWSQCAVGEASRSYDFDKYGDDPWFIRRTMRRGHCPAEPKDNVLNEVGLEFYYSVEQNDFASAREALSDIEARLREMIMAK